MSFRQREYYKRLQEQVQSVLNKGPAALYMLAINCQGAFPTDICLVLRSMLRKREIVAGDDDTFYLPNNKPVRKLVSYKTLTSTRSPAGSLPEPHPANFDWRYARTTAELVWRVIYRYTKPSDAIALFCAPTLLTYSAAKHRRAVLFDRNPEVIRRLTNSFSAYGEAIEHDIFEPLIGHAQRFMLVVADPPWYLDYYRAVLRRAQEVLRPGGILVVSVLPELTRPSAIQDRKNLLQWARAAGFELELIKSGELVYDTPEFERKTLSDHHIKWTAPWRRGDLAILRFSHANRRKLRAARPGWDVRFDTLFFDKKEIKIRRKVDRATELNVMRIAANHKRTIGTVSRRSRRRFRIDLWTSENVGYVIRRLPVVKAALVEVSKGRSICASVECIARQYDLRRSECETLRELLTSEIPGAASGKEKYNSKAREK